MLADVGDGMVSGSGRAGQFLHLQAALDTLDENMPDLFASFGGHKAVAGQRRSDGRGCIQPVCE